jgi:hypothetical protein
MSTPHFTQEQRWDHDRDSRKHEPRPSDLTISQRYALAKIIGYNEGVVKSGILPGDSELQLRLLIAETLAAFGMPSKVERESEHV